MEAKTDTRHDVIIAGVGGTGSMVIGQVLAAAGMSEYEYTLWNPSMTMARRNAPADCVTVLSKEPIGSPLLATAESVIMTESSRLKVFEPKVHSGGYLILESSGLQDEVGRDDVKVLKVPGVQIAASIGNTLARNMVLLGAYIATVKAVSPEAIEQEIKKKYSQNEKVQALNTRAFWEGVKLVTEQGKAPV